MRKTNCTININLVDVGAKADSTPAATHNSEFADAANLKKESRSIPDYMTLEWNYSLLDGSMPHMPDSMSSAGYPVFSAGMTNEARIRASEPVLSISFKEGHSSAGVSLGFIGDFPELVRVEWIGAVGAVLDERTYYPDGLNFFCENKVENYRGLKIYFEKSTVPYRFLKMHNIEYGYELIFNSESVIDAKILEEVDPISSELRINTLDFTVYDPNRDFNILNQKGKYSLLQSLQEIRVWESIDGTVIDMGTFYLESKDSKSETEITFHAIDGLGIIDKTNFIRGRIYANERAEVIIGEIMQSAGWSKYEVTDELKGVNLSGYLPVCTHRQALQQIAFALRAVVDCSRSNQIKIYRQNKAADVKIREDRIFMGDKITAGQYVSGIEVTTHQYELADKEITVFDGNLPAGQNTVTFSKPVSNLGITDGTISQSGVNYAVINMTSAGTCKITGKEYTDIQSTFVRNTEVPIPGEASNTIAVKDATLVDRTNAYLLAEHIFDYYNLRRQTEIRFLLDAEKTGRWVSIKSQYGMYINGGINRQEIDLTGGFLSNATVIGYNTQEMDYFFTGTERFTGEQIGVV